jgi:hypothetical protein
MLEWLFDLFKSKDKFPTIYHNDLDGFVSAGELSIFDKRARPAIPIDYDHPIVKKIKTGEFKMKKPFAVVDFFYLPGAVVWFDHHQGNNNQELSKEIKYHAFNEAAPSCASLILDKLKESGKLSGCELSRLEELVKFVNIVDCSTYEQNGITCNNVLFPENMLPEIDGKPNPVYKYKSGLIVCKALEVAKDIGNVGFWNSIVKKLIKNPSLDYIAQDLRIQYFYRLNMAKQKNALYVMGHSGDYSQGIYTYDVNNSDWSRFGPAHNHPKSRLWVGIRRINRYRTDLVVIKNPWNQLGLKELEQFHVGNILKGKNYKGGGHNHSGYASFPNSGKALDAIGSVLREITNLLGIVDQYKIPTFLKQKAS